MLACAGCTWRSIHTGEPVAAIKSSVATTSALSSNDPSLRSDPGASAHNADMLLWLVLAAVASVMLVATTRQISQDIAVVPLLWVMPLLTIGTLAIAYIISRELFLNIWIQIAGYSLTLFTACMVCHGELVRLKPATQYLTRFYLIIGAGGALGGTLVAVVAPWVFDDLFEYHLGLFAACLLAGFVVLRDNQSHKRWKWIGAVMLLLAIAGGLAGDIHLKQNKAFASTRSFFGITHILHNPPALRVVQHGRMIHGAQSPRVNGRKIPTSYYERNSGLGIVLAEYRRLQNDQPINKPLRIGVVGLGVGTIAALAQSGDSLRFYEIDSDVERIAREYFSFIDDSAASIDVVLGDARIMLEHEAQKGVFQNFDILIIDAFNSDAVPMHLLTREPMRLYDAHLNPHGLLAFHVSNIHLNLGAVVQGLAADAGQQAIRLSTLGSDPIALSSDWVFATRNSQLLESEAK